MASSEDTARAAGRGGLAVAGAKIYFMLVGFAQQSLLAALLGAEGYGTLARAAAIANVANNVVITSTIQGTSRVVAEAPEGSAPGAQRGALRVHAWLALPLGLLFALISTLFVSTTGASHLVPPLLAASAVVLGYALYTPFVGALNGRRLFARQALLDTIYATLRTATMLLGGWLLVSRGAGPLGAMAGMALAAFLIIPAAALAAGSGAPGPGAPGVRGYFSFIGPLALGQLFLNALLQSDISLLGYFATGSAQAAGLTGDAVAAAADRSAGLYKACQLFSFLPYQLLISINSVLFPMLARAASDGDRDAIATYVRSGMRLAALLAGVMVAVIFGLAPQLLRLTFKAEIHEHAATTLRILALGQGAFALYGICTGVLSSLHRERWTMGLNAAATALLLLLSAALVPGAPVGQAIAERTAVATSVTLVLALVAGAFLVRRTAGALLSPLSALRILAASAATAALPWLVDAAGFLWLERVRSKLLTLIAAPAMGVVYLLLLIASGELGKADLDLIKRVLGRKKS